MSQDCTTALQPGQQGKILSQKQNKAKQNNPKKPKPDLRFMLLAWSGPSGHPATAWVCGSTWYRELTVTGHFLSAGHCVVSFHPLLSDRYNWHFADKQTEAQEVKELAHSHTARESQSWEINLDLCFWILGFCFKIVKGLGTGRDLPERKAEGPV